MKNIQLKPVIIGLLITGLFACKNNSEQTTTSRGGTMEVDYMVVKPQGVSHSIQVSGSLLPAETAMVSAQASGKVVGIFFDEGQNVTKGQLLVKLDAREWLAQQKLLEAELETAQNDYNRKKELAEIQGVSAADLENAALRLSTIKAGKTEVDVKIDYASIHAPFSGIIGLRSISEGAYLAPGSAVAQLVQVDPIKLEFNVPEKYASQISVGQQVNFTITGSRNIFSGTVYATEPAISPGSRSLKVRAKVPNPKKELIPGAFADITIRLDSIPDGLMVPTDAIVPRLNEQLVYKIENGKVTEVEVLTGIRKEHTIQIESGLSPNDTIMVSGLLQARNGMPVRAGNEIKIESL